MKGRIALTDAGREHKKYQHAKGETEKPQGWRKENQQNNRWREIKWKRCVWVN